MNGVATRFDQRFDANIAALGERQPDIARLVTETADIESGERVTGRDGADVILLGERDGCCDWLGGSSMPTVSAPAAVEGYKHFNDNVLLASVGTGHEPVLLADRIADHCAVFVYAADPDRLRMALSVCDWSRRLTGGRIVVLCGDFQSSLVRFFQAHPGYRLPAHLWPLPHASRSELDHVACEMRSAIPKIKELQAARIQHAAQSVTDSSAAKPRRPTRLWIGSLDFGSQTRQHTERILNAANQLGWTARACIVDVPQHGSDVARIESAAAFDPDVALWINSCPRAMRSALPRCAHVAWFLESASLPAAALDGLADCPTVLAASEAVRQLVLAHGADPHRTCILETGVDETNFAAAADTGALNRDIDVVVFADGCDISPAAAGVGLESHQKLYAHFATLLAEHPDDFGPETIDAWLSRCENETGCRLADVQMRRDFVALIARRLPPVLLNRATLVTLFDTGLQVRLYGSGWSRFSELNNAWRGPIPPPADRADLLKNAAFLAVSWLDGPRLQFAFEALAAGCLPILRRPKQAIFAAYPQTAGLLSDLPSFNKFGELVKICCEFLGDAPSRLDVVSPLRERLLSEHTTAHRLRWLVEETARPIL